MNILMLCDFFNETLGYQENELAKHYVKDGHRVTVVTSTTESVFDYVSDRTSKTALARQYVSGGVTIVRLPYRLNLLNRVRAFAPLGEILEKTAPDLIFVHGIMMNLPDAVRYVRRNPATRIILDCHADYSNSGRNWLSLAILHGGIRKSVLDRARPYLRRIFPITPATERFLHEVYRVPHSEMELLPLGADLEASRDVQRSRCGEALRSRYGIDSADFVIFTGGKLTPAKRTEALIKAFGRLRCPNAWLVVVGDSTEADAGYLASLKKHARQYARILFSGWLNNRQILEHLDMADIAVFPASQSALWQQAIGMGKPLVIGNLNASAGRTQDVSYLNLYHNIIVAEDLEPKADTLATIIDALHCDPERCAQMSAGAERVAREILDWNMAVERTLRFTTARQ